MGSVGGESGHSSERPTLSSSGPKSWEHVKSVTTKALRTVGMSMLKTSFTLKERIFSKRLVSEGNELSNS